MCRIALNFAPRDGKGCRDRHCIAACVFEQRSSTGCRSKVERLITFSTSLVAVWYSSDSQVAVLGAIAAARSPSRLPPVRRSFQQRDLPFRERPDLLPVSGNNAEQRSSLRSGTNKAVRTPPCSTSARPSWSIEGCRPRHRRYGQRARHASSRSAALPGLGPRTAVAQALGNPAESAATATASK